ncbi:MAG: PepSY-associated TM helix domain-containing protein [Undibacterium umbellatum]|uniref:PepSY-associated TM helix domain-containing protein n=1 Tax=Undibacterium umbellatum TaxID=2762300 RepID=UPI003BB75043
MSKNKFMQSGTDNLSQQQSRAFWLRHLHQWHWISSALCLIAMILFAATGITLNHSSQIEAHPVVSKKEGKLPLPLLSQLNALKNTDDAAIPGEVTDWLAQDLGIKLNGQAPEWSPEELYVGLPRPGGDAWLRIALDNGEIEYELTSRGWIAYFNDLHKGRNTGTAWSWFIDAFAVACLIFCVTGLFLLKMHASKRPSTWPVVVFGLVMPLILALMFIH